MTWGTGRLRSLRAIHRVSAFAVMLLWCAAPILAVVHASEEAHRYCAEHDAVEEAPEPIVETTANPQSPVASGAGGGAPAHDDCSFTRLCRFSQVLGQVILDAVGDLEQRSPAAPPSGPPEPSLALILIAPKTSPPA
jgi:hypothetical protein